MAGVARRERRQLSGEDWPRSKTMDPRSMALSPTTRSSARRSSGLRGCSPSRRRRAPRDATSRRPSPDRTCTFVLADYAQNARVGRGTTPDSSNRGTDRNSSRRRARSRTSKVPEDVRSWAAALGRGARRRKTQSGAAVGPTRCSRASAGPASTGAQDAILINCKRACARAQVRPAVQEKRGHGSGDRARCRVSGKADEVLKRVKAAGLRDWRSSRLRRQEGQAATSAVKLRPMVKQSGRRLHVQRGQ